MRISRDNNCRTCEFLGTYKGYNLYFCDQTIVIKPKNGECGKIVNNQEYHDVAEKMLNILKGNKL